MRTIVAVLAVTLGAVPAFAAGHGHSASTSSSNSEKPVINTHEKLGYQKSHYEKKLRMENKEFDQAQSFRMKGLSHPPFEPDDVNETGKGAREAAVREPPPPKLRGYGAIGVAEPSARRSTSGSTEGGGKAATP